MARQHYAQGSKDFDLGRYDEAVKEYSAAYDAKPDPALLYNIAQAHKLAGHIGEAIRFYRVYLVRVPDAANADEVRAKIVELQKALDQQQRAQQMPPDVVKPLDSTTHAPPAAPPATEASHQPEPPPAPVPTIIEAPAPKDTLGARRITGIAVAGVGVAALAGGIALAVIAQQDASSVSRAVRSGGTYDASTDHAGKTFGVVGPVLIGVGAALVVGGGLLAILSRSHHSTPTAARLDSAGVHF